MSTQINIEELAIRAVQLDKANQIDQARQLSGQVLSAVKENPNLLKSIEENGLFGKSFLLMFEQGVSNNERDLQLITELSYFFLSKAIEENLMKAGFILDRVILLFNSEDFMKDTIKNALNIRINFLSPTSSPHTVNQNLDDYLTMMKIADLEDKHAIYNHISFLAQKKNEFDQLIARRYFGNDKTKTFVIKEGVELHEKVFNYIQTKIINGLN